MSAKFPGKYWASPLIGSFAPVMPCIPYLGVLGLWVGFAYATRGVGYA
jgi:hypothetical protein